MSCETILSDHSEDDVAAFGKFIRGSGSSCMQNHKQFLEDHQNITWAGNKFSKYFIIITERFLSINNCFQCVSGIISVVRSLVGLAHQTQKTILLVQNIL